MKIALLLPFKQEPTQIEISEYVETLYLDNRLAWSNKEEPAPDHILIELNIEKPSAFEIAKKIKKLAESNQLEYEYESF